MAFKFNCEHCGEELIVYYLKKGEEAQCTACSKQAIVQETAEYIDMPRPKAIPRPSLLIEQDEERRRERTREEIIRTPSVRIVKWVLDTVWYGAFILIALTIFGEVVLGPDSCFYSNPTLELPIRVRFHEPPDLIPWEGAAGESRGDGIVLLGHDFCVYKMPGGSWPPSVVVDTVLSAIFVMAAVYFLRRIFRTILDGRPFSKQNSLDFRKVGYIIAIWGPVYGTFNFLQGGYYNPWLGLANADVGVELHWYPKLIIVGLVIIAIGHLFELAARIQREQDLTI